MIQFRRWNDPYVCVCALGDLIMDNNVHPYEFKVRKGGGYVKFTKIIGILKIPTSQL